MFDVINVAVPRQFWIGTRKNREIEMPGFGTLEGEVSKLDGSANRRRR